MGYSNLWRRLLGAWNKRRDLGGNVAALVLERLVRLAVGLLVSGLLARHLGEQGFGQLSFGLSIGAIGLAVASVGLDQVLVSDIARGAGRSMRILYAALILRAMVCIPMLLAVWLWLRVTEVEALALFVLASTGMGALIGMPSLWFNARGQARVVAIVQTGVFLVASGIRLVLITWHAPLLAFAWVALGEMIFSGAILAGLWRVEVKKLGVSFMVRWSRRICVRLIRRGAPWWGAAVCVIIFTRFDQILLQRLAGVAELGIFAAASRFTEQTYLLPMALAVPMLGRLAASSGEADRTHRIRRYLAVSACAGWACAGLLWVLGPLMVHWIFGEAFIQAGSVVRVQAIALPVLFVAVARAQILAASGRGGGGALIGAVFGAITSCTLNLLLIPKMGAQGAAWTALAGQVVASILSGFCLSDWRWLSWLQLRALVVPWRLWQY